jgi:enoyl-[acyl-carrier protein] reductase I
LIYGTGRCADLAARRIHVHTIPTGAVKTTIEEIGRIATVLASDAGVPVTGSTVYAGAGFHVMA